MRLSSRRARGSVARRAALLLVTGMLASAPLGAIAPVVSAAPAVAQALPGAAIDAASVPAPSASVFTIPGVGTVTGVTGEAQALEALSNDGSLVAFWSTADLTGDEASVSDSDAFVYSISGHSFTRVSVSTAGVEANGDSRSVSISRDGRYVLFISTATNLVANDTNGAADAFVRDLQLHTTTRVDLTSAGGQIPGGVVGSFYPALLSGDGRHVAFSSDDPNVVAGDANGVTDVFVRDLDAGTTVAVSRDAAGTLGDGPSQAAGISTNGRVVLLTSTADTFVPGDDVGSTDAFVVDRDADGNATFDEAGGTTIIQVNLDAAGDRAGYPNFAALSGDGHHVVFMNGSVVLVRDLVPAVTRQVDVANDGTPANSTPYYGTSISDDGSIVAFYTGATNLGSGAGIVVHDRDSDGNASLDEPGGIANTTVMPSGLYPSMSADGSTVFDYYTGSVTTTGGGGGGGDGDPTVGAGAIFFMRDMSTGGSGQYEIWRADPGGANLKQVTHGSPAGDRYPAVSPDGSRLAFLRGDQPMILPLSGAAAPVAVGPPLGYVSPASWSPDGLKLAVTTRGPATNYSYDIATITVATGVLTIIDSDPAADQEPRWSPDGHSIAFQRIVSRGSDIWRMNADGSARAPLVADQARDDLQPTWSHDGRSLAYLSNNALRILDLASGVSRSLGVGAVEEGVAWSGDDRSIAVPVRATGSFLYHIAIADLRGAGATTRLSTTPQEELRPSWTAGSGPAGGATDTDGDGIADSSDNCPGVANASQADKDHDGIGDVCDTVDGSGGSTDSDGDGVLNATDNCPGRPNTGQADADGDGIGDACDELTGAVQPPDDDGDGVMNGQDNCPGVANPSQADTDRDGIGDACDSTTSGGGGTADDDGDGIRNGVDNCPGVANPAQADSDHDGTGDACDSDAGTLAPSDRDGDGVPDLRDNCPGIANATQADADHDGIGDVCDGNDGSRHGDNDGDGVTDGSDNCPGISNPGQADTDGDGIGDACDHQLGGGSGGDADGDTIANGRDNCPGMSNPSQADSDGDGIGDACDASTGGGGAGGDDDGDTVVNGTDNCPGVPNPSQLDTDGDGVGDACDDNSSGGGGGGGGGGDGLVDNKPLLADDGYVVEEGRTLAIGAPGVLGNDSATFRSGAHLSSTTLPAGSLTWQDDGSFTFRAPLVRATTLYELVYEGVAANGTRSSPVRVAIYVIDANHPPQARNDAYTMRFGEWFHIPAPGPLENDTDPDGMPPRAMQVVSAPPGVTAGFTSDGHWFTAQCAADNPCTIGQTLVIRYRAVDLSGDASNVATITITIVGNSPGVQNDTYSVKGGYTLTAYAPGPLVNDLCRSWDPTSRAWVQRACDGLRAVRTSISFDHRELGYFNADGGFAVDGTVGQAGHQKFITYRAQDINNVISGPATITINVLRDAAPVAVGNAYEARANTERCITGYGVLGNDTDPDDPVPTLATLVSTSFKRKEIAWSGKGDFCFFATRPGLRTFTYRAVDASGVSSNLATVTINVVDGFVAPDLPPTATNEIYYAPALETSTFKHFLANDTDPERAKLRISIISTDMPSDAYTLGSFPGSFIVKAPPLNWVGRTFTFQYAVIDPEGKRAFATATVHIDPPPTVCDELKPAVSNLAGVLTLKGTFKHCWNQVESTVETTRDVTAGVNMAASIVMDLVTLGVSYEPRPDDTPDVTVTDLSAIGWNLVTYDADFEVCWSIAGAALTIFTPELKALKYAIDFVKEVPGGRRLEGWAVGEGESLLEVVGKYFLQNVTKVDVLKSLLGENLKVDFEQLISKFDDLDRLYHEIVDFSDICFTTIWNPHLSIQLDKLGAVTPTVDTLDLPTFAMPKRQLSITYAHPH